MADAGPSRNAEKVLTGRSSRLAYTSPEKTIN